MNRTAAGEKSFLSVGEIDSAKTEGRDVILEEPANSTLKWAEEKLVCLRIDIIGAPQPLHVMFQWDSESENATVGIGCNSGNAVTRFCWRSWKDGYMGRIYALWKWRSTRLNDPHEELQKKAFMLSMNECNGEVSQFVMPIEQWPRLFSFPTDFTRDYSEDGSNSDDVKNEIDVENEIDTTSFGVECECGCKAHTIFLEADEKMDNGDEKEALALLRDCIIDHGHSVALEQFFRTVMGKLPLNEDLVDWLLDIMVEGMESIWQGKYAKKCQLFEVVDLEKLVDMLGKVYEISQDIRPLRYLCRALVLQSEETGDVNERCIEAFESLLLSSKRE